MFPDRFYQAELKQNIWSAWSPECKNVAGILPTGGGKTQVMGGIVRANQGASISIAHRQELVSQISTALARNEIRHNIIGPDSVIKLCNEIHMDKFGKSYFHPNAADAVAGVDTLIRRGGRLGPWAEKVTLWNVDECHHLLAENKWGLAARMFPNAYGLGVTATFERADGKGLGRKADGLFDTFVEGPTMRELINLGYLTDYRVIAPPPSFFMEEGDKGATGDYKRGAVAARFRKHRSRIIGDIVSTYRKFAMGKLGVTFVPDVAEAEEVAQAFRDAGVPALAVSGKNTDRERIDALKRFERREILQLANCDLFGEGFDLPAIECVSMGRHTASYSLFAQQFGRALRLLIGKELMAMWETLSPETRLYEILRSDKPRAMIFDHVGNVGTLEYPKHGLPDAPRIISLDAAEKRSGGGGQTPLRNCTNPECLAAFERVLKICPYCGQEIPAPSVRNDIHIVEGDLAELDLETLARMRSEIVDTELSSDAVAAQMAAKHAPKIGQLAAAKRHRQNCTAQRILRDSIAWWAGYERAKGRDWSESYRRFYHTFGVDVLGAQALKSKDAVKLNTLLCKDMMNVNT